MSNRSTWTKPMVPSRSHGPPSVIHAGLMRTGTLSMARAYDILGLRSHHGLDMLASPDSSDSMPFTQSQLSGHEQWALLEYAAEATWPSVPGARSPPTPRFTRAEWDMLFGTYDVLTDVASIFADQLYVAYPDAKVVIVERKFEPWWESFQVQVLDGLFHPVTVPFIGLIGWITGVRGGVAMQKMILGSFGANNVTEVRRHARQMHSQYYARIRQIVPAERRLDYKLGDGWEPLCKFLGKEIPDVPFPNVNDKVEHRARQMKEAGDIMKMAWVVLRPWFLGFASLGVTLIALLVAKG